MNSLNGIVPMKIFSMINKKIKNKENKESCTLVQLILHGTHSSRLESKGGVQSPLDICLTETHLCYGLRPVSGSWSNSSVTS